MSASALFGSRLHKESRFSTPGQALVCAEALFHALFDFRLRRWALYQRSGAPGQPSGGRAARAAQPRFTRGVSKARVVQAPPPVQCVRSRQVFVFRMHSG